MTNRGAAGAVPQEGVRRGLRDRARNPVEDEPNQGRRRGEGRNEEEVVDDQRDEEVALVEAGQVDVPPQGGGVDEHVIPFVDSAGEDGNDPSDSNSGTSDEEGAGGGGAADPVDGGGAGSSSRVLAIFP